MDVLKRKIHQLSGRIPTYMDYVEVTSAFTTYRTTPTTQTYTTRIQREDKIKDAIYAHYARSEQLSPQDVSQIIAILNGNLDPQKASLPSPTTQEYQTTQQIPSR